MMRILVFGGSWFLGRLVVDHFVRRGFEVTVSNRGRTACVYPSTVSHVCGDRECEEHLRRLARGGPWDVVLDVSGKIPAVVRRTARALSAVARRYVCISSVEAYRDWPHLPVDERSPLWDTDPAHDPGSRAWNPATYGPLKAGCEAACREAFGDGRVLIFRLHVLFGQHEYAGPLRWWLERMRRGGEILVPAPDCSIQAIDIRDVAAFLVEQVQREAAGVFNVGAPADEATFGEMLRACGDVAARQTPPELVWADEGWLASQGVRRNELPLWRTAAAQWSVSVDRARLAGLRWRPVAETVTDTWHWLAGADGRRADRRRGAEYGIDPSREAEIITRWREGATA